MKDLIYYFFFSVGDDASNLDLEILEYIEDEGDPNMINIGRNSNDDHLMIHLENKQIYFKGHRVADNINAFFKKHITVIPEK